MVLPGGEPESSIRGMTLSWAGGDVGSEPEKGWAPRAQGRVSVMPAHVGPACTKARPPHSLLSGLQNHIHIASSHFLSFLTTDMSADILPLKPVAEALLEALEKESKHSSVPSLLCFLVLPSGRRGERIAEGSNAEVFLIAIHRGDSREFQPLVEKKLKEHLWSKGGPEDEMFF